MFDGPLRSNLDFGDSNFAGENLGAYRIFVPTQESREKDSSSAMVIFEKNREAMSVLAIRISCENLGGLRSEILFFNSVWLKKFCKRKITLSCLWYIDFPVRDFGRNSNRASKLQRCHFAALLLSKANSEIEIHDQSFCALANYRARYREEKTYRDIVTAQPTFLRVASWLESKFDFVSRCRYIKRKLRVPVEENKPDQCDHKIHWILQYKILDLLSLDLAIFRQ